MKTIKVLKKSVRSVVSANKQRFLISILFLLLGVVLGVVVSLNKDATQNIYDADSLSLFDIITSDYQRGELFFDSLWRLLLAVTIIFVLSLKRATFFLSFVYVAFQGFLFAESLISVIVLSGLKGVLSGLFFILPINLLNFVVIISAQVICWWRLNFASSYRLGTKKSLKTFAIKFAGVLVLCVVSSVVYGYLFPLLLRSVIVINY